MEGGLIEKRKISNENNYTSYLTPIQTKLLRPSNTPLQQQQQQQHNINDRIQTEKEFNKIFESYGEKLQKRRNELLELKKVNELKGQEENISQVS